MTQPTLSSALSAIVCEQVRKHCKEMITEVPIQILFSLRSLFAVPNIKMFFVVLFYMVPVGLTRSIFNSLYDFVVLLIIFAKWTLAVVTTILALVTSPLPEKIVEIIHTVLLYYPIFILNKALNLCTKMVTLFYNIVGNTSSFIFNAIGSFLVSDNDFDEYFGRLESQSELYLERLMMAWREE